MPTISGTTLTSTENYSGLLYTKTDKKTRFLDAVYARGRDGGRSTVNSIQFILGNGYELEDGTQPNISETQSLTAPAPETTTLEQDENVVQIFHRSVAVSYSKMSNFDALGGVNLANATNNIQNTLDFQIGRRIDQMRIDLNYTLLNGVYQFTRGSTSVAPRSRGILTGIQSNRFDASGEALSKNMVNDVIMNSIENGLEPENLEIWINPKMMDVITDTFIQIPGTSLPSTRTVGGVAYVTIMTNYGEIDIHWDTKIPDKKIAFLNLSQISVAEKPYISEEGEVIGALVYEPLAKTGASERGQIYGEFGCNYGPEWHHAILENIGA